MMKNIDVKKYTKKVLAILVVFLPVTGNLYSQTQLYEQYKHRTDITVACIMQYPISDSVKTDVTMLYPTAKKPFGQWYRSLILGWKKTRCIPVLKHKKSIRYICLMSAKIISKKAMDL